MNNKSMLHRALQVLGLMVVTTILAFGQGNLKNGGIMRNTGTGTYKTVTNFTTSAGTILNSGTVNITQAGGTGVMTNSNGTLNGTVKNYIGGTSAGTIVCGGSTGNYTNSTGTTLNDSGGVYAGVIRVKGTLDGTGTFTTTKGVVEFNGAAQSVPGLAFGTIAATGSGVKTLAANASILDTVRLQGASLSVNGKTLTVRAMNVTTVNPTTGDTIGYGGSTASTVVYPSDSSQGIIPGGYYALTLSGATAARNKAVAGSGNLTVMSGGTLTIDSNDSLDIPTGAFSASGATFANSGWVKAGGNATFGTGITAGSFIYYASTAAQTVGTATYTNLFLRGSTSVKTMGNAGGANINVTTVYDTTGMTGGRVDYRTNTTVFAYTAAGAQTVIGGDYYDLNLNTNGSTKNLLAGAVRGRNVTIASGVTLAANSGTNMSLGFGATDGLLTVNGTINNAGTVSVTRTVAADGVTIASGAAFTNTNSLSTTNADITNNGTLTNSGTITVN